MADIVLINPRFSTSYWGMQYAMPLLAATASMPVAALPLLAALTPPQHRITIIDEDVEEIDFERCRRADMVCLTGMSVQRRRMREIATELKRRGVFTVIGGPWVSVQEDYFDGFADVIFVGEADESWPRFLADWCAGSWQSRYEQPERTDMSKVPAPRWDLLPMKRYAWASLQISRGCPFTCEFCDIIVTFGRRPRLKTAAQVIAELDLLLALGKRDVFIVDDNFIGNRKAMTPILHEIIAWQKERFYPVQFFTEASIDLADDPELMRLMSDAGICHVFVGVETVNEAGLRETKKLQNLRNATGTMLQKIHRIQDAGMEVSCGMIVGFDSDDATIFPVQEQFAREARIPNVMLGMLCAIPKTPLHARLAAEGRLDTDDEPAFGTNVIPLQMSREALSEGYKRVQGDLYAPDAYFDRLDALYLEGNLQHHGWARHMRAHPVRRAIAQLRSVLIMAFILIMISRRVSEVPLRRLYRRRLWRLVRNRWDPVIWLIYAFRCVMHYHFYRITRDLLQDRSGVFNTY